MNNIKINDAQFTKMFETNIADISYQLKMCKSQNIELNVRIRDFELSRNTELVVLSNSKRKRTGDQCS